MPLLYARARRCAVRLGLDPRIQWEDAGRTQTAPNSGGAARAAGGGRSPCETAPRFHGAPSGGGGDGRGAGENAAQTAAAAPTEALRACTQRNKSSGAGEKKRGLPRYAPEQGAGHPRSPQGLGRGDPPTDGLTTGEPARSKGNRIGSPQRRKGKPRSPAGARGVRGRRRSPQKIPRALKAGGCPEGCRGLKARAQSACGALGLLRTHSARQCRSRISADAKCPIKAAKLPSAKYIRGLGGRPTKARLVGAACGRSYRIRPQAE